MNEVKRPIKELATISNIKDLTKDIKQFTLELDNSFEFKAGQFINLKLENEDGTTSRRPYSIASHPLSHNSFELCIKLVKEGELTPRLWKCEIGDQVEIMGPLGLFSYNEETTKEKLLFIGTGTGIAPLRSIIKDLLANETTKEITLISGVRYEGDHCYDEEFKELVKLAPNFKYIPIVSCPTDSWLGRQGHVQDNLSSLDLINSTAFICGLPAMVDQTKEKLELSGMISEDIKFEKY